MSFSNTIYVYINPDSLQKVSNASFTSFDSHFGSNFGICSSVKLCPKIENVECKYIFVDFLVNISAAELYNVLYRV